MLIIVLEASLDAVAETFFLCVDKSEQCLLGLSLPIFNRLSNSLSIFAASRLSDASFSLGFNSASHLLRSTQHELLGSKFGTNMNITSLSLKNVSLFNIAYPVLDTVLRMSLHLSDIPLIFTLLTHISQYCDRRSCLKDTGEAMRIATFASPLMNSLLITTSMMLLLERMLSDIRHYFRASVHTIHLHNLSLSDRLSTSFIFSRPKTLN